MMARADIVDRELWRGARTEPSPSWQEAHLVT
jgi:hypothetical protein